MRAIRLYTHHPLASGTTLELEDDIRHYALNVLRVNKRSAITLFNGDGNDYSCEILDCSKALFRIKVIKQVLVNNESPLKTHLLLSVSKSSHMDYAIQKSVEAGVSTIQPILTERSINKSKHKSFDNKQQHWQRIIQSACEQCGRTKIPLLLRVTEYGELDTLDKNEYGLIFDSSTKQTIHDVDITNPPIMKLLVGPEGGFTENEINTALKRNFQAVRYGPRIMRTETAAVAAVLSAQLKWGDLADQRQSIS
jgi:16S rRNA (uracil1498-N3)-methyltransferase